MRRIYTNAEKLAYFQRKLENAVSEKQAAFLTNKIEYLKTLPPEEYSFQDWNSSLQAQLDEKRKKAR